MGSGLLRHKAVIHFVQSKTHIMSSCSCLVFFECIKCSPAGSPLTNKSKELSLPFSSFPQRCRTLPRRGSPWKSCMRTASPRWSFWRATWWKRAAWRRTWPCASSTTAPTSSATRSACWKWRLPSQVGYCALSHVLLVLMTHCAVTLQTCRDSQPASTSRMWFSQVLRYT